MPFVPTQDFRCSFCGKAQRDVGKLIAGTRGFICDTCVERCGAIIQRDQPEPGGEASRSLACSFCSTRREQVAHLVTGESANICNHCIEICSELLVADKKATTQPKSQTLITFEQLKIAQSDAKKRGGRLGLSLQRLGFIGAQDLMSFLARQYGVPAINLGDFEIDQRVLALVPAEVARKHLCIPINTAGNTMIVAVADPSNLYGIDDLRYLTGLNIEVVVASEQAILDAIDRYYGPQ